MTREQKSSALNVLNRISFLDSFSEGVVNVSEIVSGAKRPCIISFINTHGFNLCLSDQDFYSSLLESDLILRDGKGMEILCYSADINPRKNFCGTDFIPFLLENFTGKGLALLGTTEPFLSNAVNSLKSKGHHVVLSVSGFLDFQEYVSLLIKARPEIILLGMGMPKQEKLAALLKTTLDFPCIIINGGAIIDHLGEKVSRAPAWMRAKGMEWVYRLATEPRRLYRRYLVGNLLFLGRVHSMTGTIRWKGKRLTNGVSERLIQ